MAKSVSHNIVPITLALFVITLLATIRAAVAPTEPELVNNVATPLGSLLNRANAASTLLGTVAWAIMVIYSAMAIGQCAIRYSLYPAYTVIGIPIFGIIATAILVSHQMLLSAVALLFMALAIKYMLRYIMVSESYGDLSLAMLYFGILPIIYAPTAILYVLLPIAILLIKSHWRDWITAVTSLLFPLFALCYWSWCAGSGFGSPATAMCDSMMTNCGFSTWSLLSFASFGLIVLVLIMVSCSIYMLLSDRYALNGKARVAMRFNVIMTLVAMAMIFMPSSSATTLSLLAVPISSLTPLMFIKMERNFTRLIYRLLMIMTLLNAIILIFL